MLLMMISYSIKKVYPMLLILLTLVLGYNAAPTISRLKEHIFQDCMHPNKSYFGILSVASGNRICTKWKDSRFTYNIPGNKCFNPDNEDQPWCPGKHNGKMFCEIPACINKDIYTTQIVTKSSSRAISISIDKISSYTDGFILLLYNLRSICEESIRFSVKKVKFGNLIRKYSLNCENQKPDILFYNNIKYIFKNLKLNTEYDIYVVPINDHDTIGHITKLERRTILSMRKRMSSNSDHSAITIPIVVIFIGAFVLCPIVVFVIVKNRKLSTPAVSEYNLNERNAAIKIEYKRLNTESAMKAYSLGLTTTVGRLEENFKKNINSKLLPYDQSRVKLIDRLGDNDYINASNVPFAEDMENTEYIVCQGPTEETQEDFFDMIWQNKIRSIIMLTDEEEEEDETYLIEYCPKTITDTLKIGSSYQINLESQSSASGYIIRKIVLKNTALGETRRILHMNIPTWKEDEIPNIDHLHRLLIAVQRLPELFYPFVIHCSDGVGRSGVFLVLDRIIHQLKKHTGNINIFDIVLGLRCSRSGIITTEAQYKFLYDYVDYLFGKVQMPNMDKWSF